MAPFARLHTYTHTFPSVRRLFLAAFSASALLSVTTPLRAAETFPPLTEVYEALEKNLTGVSGDELNRAAVRGLLEQLRGHVRLEGDDLARGAARLATNAPALGARVFEKHFGFVRVARLSGGVEQELDAALKSLGSSNQLKGLIVDLRFADGGEYPAAVAVAERFLATEQPLADWGEGWRKSTAKSNAFSRPVALLVNQDTAGAAEALAGMLRHRNVALIVGTNTAGAASKTKLLPLKGGRHLRVAVAPLKVADGAELSRTGVKPDIYVSVAPGDERAWFADPFRQLTPPGTNQPSADLASAETNRAPRRRINEAELVRMSRDGQNIEREPTATSGSMTAEPAAPAIQDAALARAVDVLKGLAIVQQFRAP